MKVCNKPDSFLEDKPVWVAYLSDGTKVFQDDGRSGLDTPSAWSRLKAHAENSGLSIEKIKIRFRDHILQIPESELYHFRKGLGCFVGSEEEHFYIFGVIRERNGEKLIKRLWYKVPELVVTKKQVIEGEEFSSFVSKEQDLIIKGNKNG